MKTEYQNVSLEDKNNGLKSANSKNTVQIVKKEVKEVKDVKVKKVVKEVKEVKDKKGIDNIDDDSNNTSDSLSLIDTLIQITNGTKEYLMKEFVQFVYMNTHCIGGKFGNKLCKELPNPWSMRKDFTKEEMGYVCDCTDSEGCPVEDKINKPVKNAKLVWEFNSVKKNQTLNLEVDDLKLFKDPKVLGFMKHFEKTKDSVFMNETITITGDSHYSEDHRGSDHCLIELPVDTQITLQNPTLEQLIEALWLIKYKKFDTNYEMCIGSKILYKKNVLTLGVMFDNGS
jgi:hypothetical protein